MDKYFLLTYTELGKDGFRHYRHAWFGTKDELCKYVENHKGIEVDLAIEILSCRNVKI